HALVTGQRINNGRTEQEALVMAATMPAASVARIAPNLPVDVVALVDKALAWDRRNRFTDARDMQQAVRDALAKVEPQGEEKRRSSTPAPPPRPATVVPRPSPRTTIAPAVAPTKKPTMAPGAMPTPPAFAASAPEEAAAAENDPRVETARELFR